MEGATAEFKCEVSKPNVESAWFKDDYELIPEKGKYEMTTEGQTHSLIIRAASPSDEAEYTIELAGASSTAMLYVEGNYIIYKA